MFESISLDITAYLGFVNVIVWVQDGVLHYSRNVMTSPDKNCDDAVSSMSVDEFSKRLNVLGISGKIWYNCCDINIDCGLVYGRSEKYKEANLAAIRLEDLEEFYIYT